MGDPGADSSNASARQLRALLILVPHRHDLQGPFHVPVVDALLALRCVLFVGHNVRDHGVLQRLERLSVVGAWDQRGKVLVIGGAGFIGSHLVDRLMERGEEVIVVDELGEEQEVHLGRAHGCDKGGDAE